ncbi:MAG TPA: TIGR03862 family flavoprotein, partial [Xanthobacteraceae bacterium]|nr:TIGR03862 family flavoprotein [Xanthobacteraceae bacterium]
MSKRVAVIGAGPAGLMAAEVLAHGGAQVTVYDRMPSAGRKFLMAGRGGLNLTHSEEMRAFLARYGDAMDFLRATIAAFPPEALRAWSETLGQPTFVGSSGRVFPAAMKASPLLRAWLRRLDAAGARFALRHEWTGWDDAQRLTFNTPDSAITVEADATVLALGGASWPRLGSDGGWRDVLAAHGVAVSPLRPSNCGFLVDWSDIFRRFGGQPLKRIALSFGEHVVRGEAIVTATGLEGGAIYALSPVLREAIAANGEATLVIALRPDIRAEELERRLTAPRGKQSLSTFLRKALSLSPVEIGLLQETTRGKLATLPPAELARLINAVPIRLAGVAPVARAISTAGGIALGEVDARFMLRRLPGVFAAGEMLDWEAPTGGYLLQACFATGAAAGRGV